MNVPTSRPTSAPSTAIISLMFWKMMTASPSGQWRAICSNGDGKTLIGAIYPGNLYISTSEGQSWSVLLSSSFGTPPGRSYTSLATTNDAKTILVTAGAAAA
jgi:hypothetical protein